MKRAATLSLGVLVASCSQPGSDSVEPIEQRSASLSPTVHVGGLVDHEGRLALFVSTPVADYYYDVHGAGLLSLIDADGRDWISWNPAPDSRGRFRGVPNLGPCCHPGEDFSGTTTRLAGVSSSRVLVISEGRLPERWQLVWEFLPDRVNVTVVDPPGRYFFLYEGTPGGALGAEDRIVLPGGTTSPLLDFTWNADLDGSPEWAAFADADLHRSLLVVHHGDDDVVDQYWTFDDAMTVFGFGRGCTADCRDLSAAHRKFTLSFADTVDAAELETIATGLGT